MYSTEAIKKHVREFSRFHPPPRFSTIPQSRFAQELSFTFLGATAKLRKATISFVMSVCSSARPPAWYSAPNGRIFIKFNTGVFCKNLSRKFKFDYNLTRITGTLHGNT